MTVLGTSETGIEVWYVRIVLTYVFCRKDGRFTDNDTDAWEGSDEVLL